MSGNPTQPASPEYVHAFVDGELAGEELHAALARMHDDPAFRAAVGEARALKHAVRAAYPVAPANPRSALAAGGWRHALAAGLLLAVGMGGGWWLNDLTSADAALQRRVGLPEGYHALAAGARVDAGRVLLHVDAGEPERLIRALDLAETLLARHGERARIHIVFNGAGLDLVRADRALADPAMARRVQALAARHANLGLVACGQTVARLQREGERVELMPVARTAASAIHEITTRMSEGWVYVKV